MATHAMPLILDSTMGDMAASMPVDLDVDDVELFGAPVVDLSLSSQPPPSKQLRLRVDEMRIRGCCQRIAWSRQGTIASISADGFSVELRYLRTNPHDGMWGLSEPTPCSQISGSHNFSGGPIVHLAWAATASPELAIIDAAGRVSILTFSMNLNRPYPLRTWDVDTIDDLHSVVGAYWLPLMPQTKQSPQYNIVHGPAVRDENGYRYESTLVPAFGPYHPNPLKSALLCVTASGVLKLFFSQNNNKTQDTSLELDSFSSSDDLVTHASICSDKVNTLTIALVTASGQIKVVRALIHWIPTHGDKQQQQQQQQQQSQPLNPSLHHRAATVTTWLQHSAGESQLDISSDQISHVEMLPSTLVAANTPLAPPVVLTVRTYLPAESAPFNEQAQSIIDRWELRVDPPATPLHEAFEKVGSKPAQPTNTQSIARLHKMEPIVLNKVVVCLNTIQFGKVICISFSDGTVQYRDRLTMQEIYNEQNLGRIMTLGQANFQFTDPTPCVSVAFSPTNCSFVQVCEDGCIKWNSMKHDGPNIGDNPKNPEYAAVVAALTLAVSTASLTQINYDDVLATARQFVDKPKFAYDWIMDIVRMLKINVDYSEEAHHDQLIRNHSLLLCLSILNHLGFRGEFRPRAFCGKFAMLALNVRNIAILITIANNTSSNLKDKLLNPLDEPEVVDALADCARWALDLLAYIADSIFNLLDDPRFMSMLAGSNFGELAAYMQEKNEVTLHLLLCSSTRGFLSAACRRLAHMEGISTKATHYYESQSQLAATSHAYNGNEGGNSSHRPVLIPLSLAYQKMQQYTSSSLVRVAEFDKFLTALGEEIRQTYQQRAGQKQGQGPGTGLQQQDTAVRRLQAHCELALLLANNPPQTFQPMLFKFFNENVRAFRAVNDPARLFFADYSILEINDEERTLQARRARHVYIDGFRRTELVGCSGEGGTGTAATAAATSASGTLHGKGMSSAGTHGISSTAGLWRRCARCAAVMEDVFAQRPGYTFVVSQQRKCSCGGNWGLLPRGSLVG